MRKTSLCSVFLKAKFVWELIYTCLQALFREVFQNVDSTGITAITYSSFSSILRALSKYGLLDLTHRLEYICTSKQRAERINLQVMVADAVDPKFVLYFRIFFEPVVAWSHRLSNN